MKKNAHVIAHSHWDREWYMPFEYHRAKLVRLIDECMELFESDEEFANFHLDGHTALLEDYLEIKPQKKEKIKQYVKEGKFTIGPWYILQDEFLTSSEANVRNLLVGMNMAKEFGKCSLLGYFPDSFGNAGQMPQLMKQAGMKAIAFGRGVKPTGMNNFVSEVESHSSVYSELYWQSPDGSTLPSILFANWYNNAWEIPENADAAYWDGVLENVEKYASTKELLLMNGCDHQPVQKNLTKALKAAGEKYQDYHFIHSSFEQYIEAVLKNLPEDLAVIRGELTGQNTDGWFNLVNTASAHVDLKQLNKHCENLLENAVEPLSVIAGMLGKEVPREMTLYAWKTLMKNHPHDSICTCSCDEVSEEMHGRFLKCCQTAESLINENLDYISQHVDCTGFLEKDLLFTVINTFAKERSGVVEIDIDTQRLYCQPQDIHETFEKLRTNFSEEEFLLVDCEGKELPCKIMNYRIRFGYDLPEDCFRKTYVAQTVTVLFEAEHIPAMGYRVFALRHGRETVGERGLVKETNTMENRYLKVSIKQNGTLWIYDKENDRTFSDLLQFEDTGDLGTEYTFIPVSNDIPILSANMDAKIELVCNEEFLAEYKITTKMQLPVSADAVALEERNTYTALKERHGKRSKTTITVPIVSYVALAKNARSVKIRTEIKNDVKDHRLRVLFPTGMDCLEHMAESIFEAVVRENKKKDTWTYPSGCERQQDFVLMQDQKSGIGIGNKGLHEYEILQDHTIAITLVRAVGEMGDWGVFPTELSQMQKTLTFEYEITPFKEKSMAFLEFAAFQYSLWHAQIMKQQDVFYQNGEFVWEGENLKPCVLKPSYNGNDVIMRWANYSAHEQVLTIQKTNWISDLYKSNVIEEKGEMLLEKNGKWEILVKPFEIVTVGCRKETERRR